MMDKANQLVAFIVLVHDPRSYRHATVHSCLHAYVRYGVRSRIFLLYMRYPTIVNEKKIAQHKEYSDMLYSENEPTPDRR